MIKATTLRQRLKLLNQYTKDKYILIESPEGNTIYKNDELFIKDNNNNLRVKIGGLCYTLGLMDLDNNIIAK
jgi:hypothetical protein